PASVALMADVSSREERASSVALVGAAFGIGMVLGPAAAALLVGFGILVPLYVIAGLGLLTALLASFRLPAVAPQVGEDQGQAEAKGLIPLLIGALLVYLAISSMQQTLAFHVQDLLGTDMQDTARLTGFCFMAIAIATLAMQGGVIQVLKPSPRVLLLVGLPIGFFGFLVYASATSYLGVLFAASLIGIGFGLVNPGLSAAASLRTGVDAQGRTAGLMQAMMSAGYVFGPITATTLYEIDRQYAVLLALTAVGLAIVIVGGWLLTLRVPTATAGEAL
ncbi:MAG: MFS transporter, partial [Pseudomonadota bacterium]